ncbi:MAG: homoserine dehydrogenase [Rickettsiales bacterium]|nr:homoserine dehydrogenase [Rickettsiales bacterium]
MTTPLRVGIAGLGTVGGGTLSILRTHANLLKQRTGRPIEVVAIAARDQAKKRPHTEGLRWVDTLSLATDPSVDVVVELIGGSEGIARELVETALKNGKSVVTANKALIAHHGIHLATLAEASGAVLAFEAAVAGGIPIIKALRDGLSANRFRRVIGILNGTCNYILTQMWETRKPFDIVLKEAQALGYAEAEPSFDVDGIDTAHKLAILTSLAFGTAPAINAVYMEGIRRITLQDMDYAHQLGYAIKLLGIATETEGRIEQRVHPCMVPAASALGTVPGVFNAILAEGDAVGTIMFEGRGAGAGPTASSVVADIMDIARGVAYKPFTLAVADLASHPSSGQTLSGIESLRCSYYVRLSVIDRPGVLAEVTALFKEENISLRSFLQHSHASGENEKQEPVNLVITTHETQESAMLRASAAIAALSSVKEKPYCIRIENV